MFQTITTFGLKLKPWRAKVKTNNFMHFDVLSKHNPVNSKKKKQNMQLGFSFQHRNLRIGFKTVKKNH